MGRKSIYWKPLKGFTISIGNWIYYIKVDKNEKIKVEDLKIIQQIYPNREINNTENANNVTPMQDPLDEIQYQNNIFTFDIDGIELPNDIDYEETQFPEYFQTK